MFDWINDNILSPAKDAVGSLAKEIGRGISSVSKEIGRVTEKIGVVGAMALTTILPAVADKFIAGTMSTLKAISEPVATIAKGLFDYTSKIVTNGKNYISNISEAIFNTAKNFTKTLGKKLGLDIDNASNTFFQGSDSAWARSTGKASTNLNNIVSSAGGVNKLSNIVAETVTDAPDIVDSIIEDVVEDTKRIETNVEVAPLNIDGNIQLADAEEIANFNTELTVERPEINVGQVFNEEDLNTFDVADITGEIKIDAPSSEDIPQPSLLERTKQFGKELAVDTGRAAVDAFKKAPSQYIDTAARTYVKDKVEEDLYGTPEERFQKQVEQQKELTAASTTYTSAPMLQFGTQTGGASVITSPTAYTYTAPVSNTNAAWGYNAYNANVYGDRLRQFQ